MKNSTIRTFLRHLADAPAIALEKALKSIDENDKPDALRLADALGVKISKGGKESGKEN